LAFVKFFIPQQPRKFSGLKLFFSPLHRFTASPL